MTATLHFNLYMLIRAAQALAGLPMPIYDKMVDQLNSRQDTADQAIQGLRLFNEASKALVNLQELERARSIQDALYGTNLSVKHADNAPIPLNSGDDLFVALDKLIKGCFARSISEEAIGNSSSAMSWSVIARMLKDVQRQAERRRESITSA